VAFVPSRLGGILNLFRERQMTYDATTQQFLLSRLGYAGFRLYAKTIDDVDPLRRYFESQGLPVHTEAQRIQDVTDLDRYLTLLFWGIAAVGIVGGATALLASLYAAVERKKRDLGVLRLLGISRRLLFRYPMYQGLMISGGGFATAMLFFAGMAMAINSWFHTHLGPGESFCRLPATHTAGALGLNLLVAMLAATCAAWRVTQIDPAEALRDE
jgi:putative ABC transport system permease protein